MEQLPKSYQQFSEQFPDVIQAYSDLGKAVHQSGPLDRKTRELIKLVPDCINAGTYYDWHLPALCGILPPAHGGNYASQEPIPDRAIRS
jgi:hypothetical protein